ncbi:MAG: type IV pilin accessory protein [Methyloglobulus sp.]|nr:type IV pilin accessory protein [Methyloglobulus sp.]
MKSRFPAFLTHLTISGVVAALAMMVVFFVWYPAPLHTAVGVTQIFLMLLAIDIIIGPVITFIIYKPNKSSLKFDLTVIALLQLSALGYGMNTVFEGRPAFVVFNVDRYTIARAFEIDTASMTKAEKNGNESAKISWFQPKWVAAVASTDSKRRQEIMFSSAMGGADWPLLPELYVPLTQEKSQILKKAKPLEELRRLHSNDASALTDLAVWNDNNVKWLPLIGKVRNMVVLVDAGSAKVIQILDMKPWPN